MPAPFPPPSGDSVVATGMSRPIRQATCDDMEEYGIKRGYDVSLWNANRPPIWILGSIFDVHSLGSWIMDWTVHCSAGPASILCETAANLWKYLLLLDRNIEDSQVAMKSRRLTVDEHNSLDAFIILGSRLIALIADWVGLCQTRMLQAIQDDTEGTGIAAGFSSYRVCSARKTTWRWPSNI